MKKLFCVFFAFYFPISASAQQTLSDVYRYANKSFGYGFEIVQPLASMPIVPADGNNQEFVFMHGDARLRAFGETLGNGHLSEARQGTMNSLTSHGFKIVKNDGDTTNWFELNATKENKTILVRMIKVCNGKATGIIWIQAPTSEFSAIEVPLKRLRETMKPNGSPCVE
jgi:hypothetical protein